MRSAGAGGGTHTATVIAVEAAVRPRTQSAVEAVVDDLLAVPTAASGACSRRRGAKATSVTMSRVKECIIDACCLGIKIYDYYIYIYIYTELSNLGMPHSQLAGGGRRIEVQPVGCECDL